MTVLDSLFQIFSGANHMNLFAQGQAAVLLTGMGLLNVQGRLAFFIAVNQCCATVFELLYHEIEAAGEVPIRNLSQPTYGRKRTDEINHANGFAEMSFHYESTIPKHYKKASEEYGYVLQQLSMTP